MDLFTRLFGDLLTFVYHCFDRVVIHGYLTGLSRPEQVVYFFRQVLGIAAVDKEVLSRRTKDYQEWVEAFARNHRIPIEWAEKGVRKEEYVLPALRRIEKRKAFGVYLIFKSMELGRTFRISMPKFPTQDPHYRKRNARKSTSRFYAIAQVEYCRNFIFKRHFPIHKIFERSCEIGLWRLTANRISEIFGVRLTKKLRGKLATVVQQIEHGHHVFRANFKSALLYRYEKFSAFCAMNCCPTTE